MPGLRNVAITGPYMHNGLFKELRPVLGSTSGSAQAVRKSIQKPGSLGRAPRSSNLALESLKTAPALNESETGALVAFLKTLTDRHYERLLD